MLGPILVSEPALAPIKPLPLIVSVPLPDRMNRLPAPAPKIPVVLVAIVDVPVVSTPPFAPLRVTPTLLVAKSRVPPVILSELPVVATVCTEPARKLVAFCVPPPPEVNVV